MNHAQLRTNVEHVLDHYFGEPYTASGSIVSAAETARFELSPVRPNPFSSETVIPFALPASGPVELSVYDATGRRVKTILSGTRPAGRQVARWDATDRGGNRVAAGVYFVRLHTASRMESRSVVVLH
jgi:hypothetical protein